MAADVAKQTNRTETPNKTRATKMRVGNFARARNVAFVGGDQKKKKGHDSSHHQNKKNSYEKR